MGTEEMGTELIGAEANMAERGTDEIGTDEMGTEEIGTEEIGTEEIGTDEIGAELRDACFASSANSDRDDEQSRSVPQDQPSVSNCLRLVDPRRMAAKLMLASQLEEPAS